MAGLQFSMQMSTREQTNLALGLALMFFAINFVRRRRGHLCSVVIGSRRGPCVCPIWRRPVVVWTVRSSPSSRWWGFPNVAGVTPPNCPRILFPDVAWEGVRISCGRSGQFKAPFSNHWRSWGRELGHGERGSSVGVMVLPTVPRPWVSVLGNSEWFRGGKTNLGPGGRDYNNLWSHTLNSIPSLRRPTRTFKLTICRREESEGELIYLIKQNKELGTSFTFLMGRTFGALKRRLILVLLWCSAFLSIRGNVTLNDSVF